MKTLLAMVSAAKARAVEGTLGSDVETVSFGERRSVDAAQIVAVKWHPTDETTYGVSAYDWNRWLFSRLMADNPAAKVVVI